MKKFIIKNWFKLLVLFLLLMIAVSIIFLVVTLLFNKSDWSLREENNQSITGQEVAKYLNGVVEIKCGNSQGSGILWLNNDIPSVLTNKHMVSDLADDESCVVDVGDGSKNGLSTIYETVNMRHSYQWDEKIDIVVLPLIERGPSQQSGSYTPVLKRQTVPLKDLDYSIFLMDKCISNMSIGSPVIVVGYPASTIKSVETDKWIFFESSQTLTDGIISALYDSVDGLGNQVFPNYFVSAKIDSGNSGGVAFSKKDSKLCLLGVTTWLNLGQYDAQGVVQNIHNIMYQK